MEKYKKCPKCKYSSTTTHWDENTKELEGIKPNDPFTSCTEDKEELKEYEIFFRCPICGKEIPGHELQDVEGSEEE